MGGAEQRAWAVRPKPHGTKRIDVFLEKGIVALGWPTVGDLTEEDRGGIKDRLRKEYPGKSGRSIGSSAGELHRFVNEIEKGDLVVAPDGGTLYVGRVTSKYTHEPDVAGGEYGTPEAGYPHQRSVDWVQDGTGVPRSLATGSLYSSLKSQLTVFELPLDDVADLADRIPSEGEGGPEGLQEDYLDRLQSRTLPGMNDSSFEDAVRIVLGRHFPGLSRQSTSSDQEGDTDLLTELPGEVTIRIQVKYYDPEKGAVKEGPVDQLAASMEPGDNGLVVTSGEIGEAAEQATMRIWKEEQKAVGLIDGEEFVELLFENLPEYTEEELHALALRRNLALP